MVKSFGARRTVHFRLEFNFFVAANSRCQHYFYSLRTLCQSVTQPLSLVLCTCVCKRTRVNWYIFTQVRCYSLEIKAIHVTCGCFKTALSQYFSFHLVSFGFVWFRFISFQKKRNGELRSQVQSELQESLVKSYSLLLISFTNAQRRFCYVKTLRCQHSLT